MKKPTKLQMSVEGDWVYYPLKDGNFLCIGTLEQVRCAGTVKGIMDMVEVSLAIHHWNVIDTSEDQIVH